MRFRSVVPRLNINYLFDFQSQGANFFEKNEFYIKKLFYYKFFVLWSIKVWETRKKSFFITKIWIWRQSIVTCLTTKHHKTRRLNRFVDLFHIIAIERSHRIQKKFTYCQYNGLKGNFLLKRFLRREKKFKDIFAQSKMRTKKSNILFKSTVQMLFHSS